MDFNISRNYFREFVEEEIREHEKKKKEFYDNPLYWSNNRRRRHGLPPLRGEMNKYRLKRCSAFHPSAKLFCLLDDVITEKLKRNLQSYFDSFVAVHNRKKGK